MELPTYRVPSFKTLWRSTWEKAKGFCQKAGTFIFGGSVVIWTLTYIGPHGVNVPINQSFMHMIGQGFANLIAPLGFGSWQAGATLIPGFLAKEVIISSMAILYSSSESGFNTSHSTAIHPTFSLCIHDFYFTLRSLYFNSRYDS